METAVSFAKGPLLILAFSVFFLGVARQMVVSAVELVRAYRKAGDEVIPWGFLFRKSLGWIIPVNALRGTRIVYTVASFIFHAGMLLVPLFLAGHVTLIHKGIGLAWPTLHPATADGLTLAAMAALLVLFLLRLVSEASRFLSRFQDWFLLILCLLPFCSGYLVAHPAVLPLPFSLVYLVHLLSSELLLALLPFTKLAHSALFPFTRLSWELGWHFVPGSGERVRMALGKEGEPV